MHQGHAARRRRTTGCSASCSGSASSARRAGPAACASEGEPPSCGSRLAPLETWLWSTRRSRPRMWRKTRTSWRRLMSSRSRPFVLCIASTFSRRAARYFKRRSLAGSSVRWTLHLVSQSGCGNEIATSLRTSWMDGPVGSRQRTPRIIMTCACTRSATPNTTEALCGTSFTNSPARQPRAAWMRNWAILSRGSTRALARTSSRTWRKRRQRASPGQSSRGGLRTAPTR
mmetsp:Transcript_47091/g.131366  ORF Transcript_47091/g.131366 Transcript_47091/m.131366 type:complete len:229 (+) Transcript_47091:309-995(+)